MNRQTTKLFLIALFFLFSCQPQEAIDIILNEFNDSNSENIMVVAHRGSHKNYVENSVSAVQDAIKMGVDIIEVDVKVTKDNVPVLNNDRKINRTTNGTGNPEEYTWIELQKFKLKLPDGTVTDEKMASLEKVLKIAKGKVMIDIDIKSNRIKPIVDIVIKTGTENQVIFFHNKFDILTKILEMLPEAIVMPLPYSYQLTDSALNVFSPKVVHINESLNTPEICNLIKNNNSRIWINALGKPDDHLRKNRPDAGIKNLLLQGANIVQTDEPELMIRYLKSKGLRK